MRLLTSKRIKLYNRKYTQQLFGVEVNNIYVVTIMESK